MANKNPAREPSRQAAVRKRGPGRPYVRRNRARLAAARPPVPMPAPRFNPSLAFPPVPVAPENPRELDPVEIAFGGKPHVLRPLTLADEGRLISFFNSHTEETIRQRYGYHICEMTPERARRLVGVDPKRDLGLGVFERASDGEEVLHAVGRYLLDPDGRTAEMAFVVRETKRGLGICTVLLRTLLRVARHRGMNYLYAQVQTDNAPMLSVFRRHGGRIRPILGTDTLEVFVPTAQP